MFKLLRVGDHEWIPRIMGASARDIHFDQRVLAPYVSAFKWQAYLAVTDGEMGNYITQPILLTKDGEFRHAFNFGGPLASNQDYDASLVEEHNDELDNLAVRWGVKKQHCTLIPFYAKEQLNLISEKPAPIKQSVIIDLHNQKVRSTTRKMANKAQVAGAKVVSVPLDEEHLKKFYEMYEATMDRVSAKDHWHLGYQWFAAFAKFVKPQLLMVAYDGSFEGGCLVAYSPQYPVGYYHFAASTHAFPQLGLNHMLVLAAGEFVRSVGMRYLYLGGGVTPKDDDGLLTFKSGFSQLRLPVYSYERAYHDPNTTQSQTIIGMH